MCFLPLIVAAPDHSQRNPFHEIYKGQLRETTGSETPRSSSMAAESTGASEAGYGAKKTSCRPLDRQELASGQEAIKEIKALLAVEVPHRAALKKASAVGVHDQEGKGDIFGG